ncbi:ribosomal protein L11 methyltransferase [Methanobrevibacter cuticularis]|uniref:Ribosomal protein L11 methyltransferase n=1 Tax=Methanobrevibacter cuticularis TaxID=47311 RepID=A0A166CRC0_9EURY|nr:methyltransferase domain-containing protein [Methanobrevibacter cuticularis]KZX16237.1 ribosomal protein L11 methyltransferase [Methanobrevibacter cuticularis]
MQLRKWTYISPYHSNLIKDTNRLAVFHEGIKDYYYNIKKENLGYTKNQNKKSKSYSKKLDNIVYDLGTGSGILAYFASKYFKSVIAIDKDSKIIECAKKSFVDIKNITFISQDALKYEFKKKADLVICEMLDTALIEEEEVLVLNRLQDYIKEDGKVIPQGIINIAEPVHMENDKIHYEDVEHGSNFDKDDNDCDDVEHGSNFDKYVNDFDNIKYKLDDNKNDNYHVLGKSVEFSSFDFLDYINPNFKTVINFKIDNFSEKNENKYEKFINGIKITTFTKINEDIICGPTPMLNPPLFIPLETHKNMELINKDEISIELQYIMGGGLETIKAKII